MTRQPQPDRRKRRNWGALGAVILLLLIGCAGGEGGNPTGSHQTSGSNGSSPEPSDDLATPAPTPSPTPTTAPTATPEPVPRYVSIQPASVKLWLSSTETTGEALGKPGSAQLTATVTMSDGSQRGTVTWRSLSPLIAAVDSEGRVMAVGPGEGAGPWVVAIEAVAPDGKTVGTRQVSVYAEGGVDVIIR